MKRIVLFIMTLLLTLTLFACNDGGSDNTFTGTLDGTDVKLVLDGSSATLYMNSVTELSEEDLAEAEIEGTLKITQSFEISFSAATEGDTVTLTADPLVQKGKAIFGGSGAEAYIEMQKTMYAEYKENGWIDEEQYQQQIDLLDGKTVTRTQEGKYEFVVTLDRKKGTLRFDQNTAYNEDGSVAYQSKYEYDGTTLIREIYLRGEGKTVYEYYASGEKKSATDYESDVLTDYIEYYENGEWKSSTRYYENGKVSTYIGYYENGEMKHYISYDEDGTISIEEHYDENGDLIG